jgi:uncharacterized protein DUF222/HNH endonuclease
MGVGGASPAVLPLDDLAGAVHRFSESPRMDRTPDGLAEELTQLRHLIDRLELRFAQTASEFADTNAWEDWGSVSPIQWIRYECKMAGGAAADRVCVGQQLGRLPLSSQAMADGDIGFGHLVVIARTADALTSSDTATGFDEEIVLKEAKAVSVGRLWRFCHHVRHAADPKGFAAEEADAVERRRLQLSPCEDGSLLVDGWLDSAGGAALRTALEPLARPAGAEDDRCRERRLADALVELATHALDTALVPQRAGQRPHLQVTTTLETLRGLAGAPAGELEFSLPISATTVQRLACDSTITRVVLGSQSVVIDVGRAKRVVAGTTRRAVDARDGHCQWPRCDRPPSWSAAHHVVHWTRGGTTNLSNLVLLCHRHHWLAHEGGWQLVRTDDGRLLTIPPEPGRFPSIRSPGDVPAA